jgi:hypothetical protein
MTTLRLRVKVQLFLSAAWKRIGGEDVHHRSFLPSAVHRGEWLTSRPWPLCARVKSPGNHSAGDCFRPTGVTGLQEEGGGGQRGPRVLGTLIYEGVKLDSGRRIV